MKRLFSSIWAMLFIAFAPFPAIAQSVALRAGEHGDFTRLVLPIDGFRDWSLGRTEKGYGLVLSREDGMPDTAPDITDTFSKIARDRVSEIRVEQRPDGSDLILIDLACDCHAQPFILRDDYIVIDIRDGAAPTDSPYETVLKGTSGDPSAISPADANEQSFDWLNTIAGLPKAKVTEQKKQETISPEPAVDAAPATRPEPPRPSPLEPKEPVLADPLETAQKLDDFRQSLIEGISSAASTGKVEMIPEADRAPSDTTTETPNMPALAGLNLGNETALSAQGAICPDEKLFDLAAWSALLGENAYLRMTETRARLIGEFDAPDDSAVLETVRANLALGFGHESRQILSSFAPRTTGNETLIALSYIVDGETPPENPLEGFHSCPSDAALWSLLAAPPETALPNLDADAVARAFLELPPYLRVQLARPVADRLLANGVEKSARMIRDATDRTGPEAEAVIPVLDAKMELAVGNPAEAEAAIAHSPASAAAEMILLVEARFQQKKSLDAEDRLALESFVFSEGSGEQGKELQRSLALAMALDGRADQALALAGQDAATKADLWQYIAETGSDGTLIEAAGRATPAEIATVAPAARTKISDRLLEIGLPDLAQDWLPDPDNQPNIMAAIHLAERDGLSAIVEIGKSAATPEARADLQAKAYRGLGDYPKASELLLSIGQVAEAERIQRWARVWDPATSKVDDLWRQIGLDTARITTPSTPVSLHLGKDLIGRSEATREKVEALLAETNLSEIETFKPVAGEGSENQ